MALVRRRQLDTVDSDGLHCRAKVDIAGQIARRVGIGNVGGQYLHALIAYLQSALIGSKNVVQVESHFRQLA